MCSIDISNHKITRDWKNPKKAYESAKIINPN